MEVWKQCRELRIGFETLVKTFPSEEKFRLSDQIIRAARSVTNNIAEEYGRFHYQDSIKFYLHSRGSLYELIDHLAIAKDNGFIEQNLFIELRTRCINLTKLLNGFIRYVKAQKQSTK